MKFTPCRKCSKSSKPGYLKTERNTYIECSCHKQWRLDEEFRLKLEGSGLSESDANLKNYYGTESVESFLKLKDVYIPKFKELKDKPIYIYGPNGTQKTTVTKWVGTQILKQGFSVYYCLMQNLIKDLTILVDEEREQATRQYYESDLLIIDEAFDRTKITIYKSNFQIPFLDTFLRYRLDTLEKGIIFVSNVSVESIQKADFGESLYDFINRKIALNKSSLKFTDKYVSLINKDNLKGIFE